ncbi:hypothetical protein L1785_16935 [Antribacter sp. KLBMP9083]|uniref:DUF4352 domain-containing protein n=1 Tax=Antribacter soli TaxID=2910976 RepID=A0AA41QGF9_9MICO|nr:hypothetical protein [Antribacter soli]MCF4122666.1 hypothetical protein [Antribacter soli]
MTAPRILFDPAKGARHARRRAGIQLSPGQRSAAAGAALALALVPTGAYQRDEPEPEPLVTGETVLVGPFEVTIRQVAVIPELGYLIEPEGGNRVLAVVADVTNTSDVPEGSATLTDAMPAPADGAVAPPDTFTRVDEEDRPVPWLVRAVDGTDPSPFSPGLTHRVVLAWEQEAGWDGSTITLEIDVVEWIEEGALRLDNEFWLETGDGAYSGVFPVEDLTQDAEVRS